MNVPISSVEFSTLLLELHVCLKKEVNAISLLGKDMLRSMAEVSIGRQVQITRFMRERLFRSFNYTCSAALALCSAFTDPTYQEAR